MSINNILNKLAEKEALKGNQDYAYNFVVLASSGKCKGCDAKCDGEMCSACSKKVECDLKGCNVKKAVGEMVKHGDKYYCCDGCVKKDSKSIKSSTLDTLINKYAKIN